MAICAAQMLAVCSAGTDGQNSIADIFRSGEFFVGCNYWSKNAGMYMWRDWRPDVVEREICELAKNGKRRIGRVAPL